ncbi:MAG TPA: class D sortase [Abditibacteriaceae bacterium]|nr:class D sortase [Abditibacteriaceae bacterium]
MKRALRPVLSLICVVGVVIALWPLGQTAYAWWSQYTLRAAWRAEASQARHSAVPRAKAKPRVRKPAPLAAKPGARAAESHAEWPPTRIVAPDIGLDTVVIQGWAEADLRRAPGHYPISALPGEAGNCIIAGHRNIYGSWFYRVNELEPGATIELRTPRQTFSYQVTSIDIVTDTDSSIMAPAANQASAPQLTLITCTVPLTADRIIVRAAMMAEGVSSGQ